MAKKQNISVIERRLQGASALSVGSVTIPLTDPTWTIRWENSEIAPDHIWKCINHLGWEYVQLEDIACALDEVGARIADGRVVRGERGREVLLKMRVSDYKKVQQKKTKENLALTFDKQKLKSAVVGAVATEHGDQAAEFMHKNTMTVQDSRERVSLDE